MKVFSPARRRTQAGLLFIALLVAAAAVRHGASLWAHPEGVGAIESYLHGLLDDGAITEAQHEQIERLFAKGLLDQLGSWLTAQEEGNRISADTHQYVNALLELTPAETTLAVAPAAYTGNGNVTLLGRLDSQPPNPYYGDNSSTGTLYNGIWGYAAGVARVRTAGQQLRPAHHRRHHSGVAVPGSVHRHVGWPEPAEGPDLA